MIVFKTLRNMWILLKNLGMLVKMLIGKKENYLFPNLKYMSRDTKVTIERISDNLQDAVSYRMPDWEARDLKFGATTMLSPDEIGADINENLMPVVGWYNTLLTAYDRNVITGSEKKVIDYLRMVLSLKVKFTRDGMHPRTILGTVVTQKIENKSIDKV